MSYQVYHQVYQCSNQSVGRVVFKSGLPELIAQLESDGTLALLQLIKWCDMVILEDQATLSRKLISAGSSDSIQYVDCSDLFKNLDTI